MHADKFQKIKNLYERGATEGERQAAAAAMDRLRLMYGAAPPPLPSPHPKRKKAKPAQPKAEQLRKHRFFIADRWDRLLFEVLCNMHGIELIHEKGQRKNTVLARSQKSFVKNTLWPEFLRLQKELHDECHDAVKRVLRKYVFKR